MGYQKIRMFSMRYARWLAGSIAADFYPPLHRRMPMFRDALSLAQGGDVQTIEEVWDTRLNASQMCLTARSKSSRPLCIRRSLQLARLDDVSILGNTGSIIDEHRRLWLNPRGARPEASYHSFRPERTVLKKMPEANYFHMVGPHAGHRHYFHFFIDRLPRLLTVLQRFEVGRQPIVVLTNENLPAFQTDIYSAIARRHANVRFEAIPQRERWSLPALYCLDDVLLDDESGQIAENSYMDRNVSDMLRKLALEEFAPLAPLPRRRIYISRNDTRRRRVENEDQLLPILQTHGFERVLAAELPFREQVALFAEARVICGAHGAGLTNMIFAPPGAAIVELFPGDKVFGSYTVLAEAVGHSHTHVIGSARGQREYFRVTPRMLDDALGRATGALPEAASAPRSAFAVQAA